jgi:hypothetical protein
MTSKECRGDKVKMFEKVFPCHPERSFFSCHPERFLVNPSVSPSRHSEATPKNLEELLGH